MKKHPAIVAAALALTVIGLSFGADLALASGQELVVTEEDFAEEKIYSPYAGRAYADQVFFGDMHFHTNLSFDAGLIGTTLDAHDGFRMARGEQVISNTGQPVQLMRPLDFLVITDHAEMMGLAPAIRESSPILLAEPWGQWIHERFNSGPEGRMEAVRDVVDKGTTGVNPFGSDELTRSIWEQFIEIADQYNQPGHFTAMIGFEWTSTPNGDNLHRVVVFGMAPTRLAKPRHSPCLTAMTRRTSGPILRTMSRRPGGRRWPSPTTATSAMA